MWIVPPVKPPAHFTLQRSVKALLTKDDRAAPSLTQSRRQLHVETQPQVVAASRHLPEHIVGVRHRSDGAGDRPGVLRAQRRPERRAGTQNERAKVSWRVCTCCLVALAGCARSIGHGVALEQRLVELLARFRPLRVGPVPADGVAHLLQGRHAAVRALGDQDQMHAVGGRDRATPLARRELRRASPRTAPRTAPPPRWRGSASNLWSSRKESPSVSGSVPGLPQLREQSGSVASELFAAALRIEKDVAEREPRLDAERVRVRGQVGAQLVVGRLGRRRRRPRRRTPASAAAGGG